MTSATAVTYLLDDPHRAAAELADQINGALVLQRNSVGILFGEADMDHDALLAAVNQAFPFDILGGSAMGILEGREGFRELAVTLLVLTADDCGMAVTCTAPLDAENMRREIEKAWSRGLEQLDGQKPQLAIAVPPHQLDTMLDHIPSLLDEISGGVPVFGGVPSSENNEACVVYADGRACGDRMALLLLSGDIRPVFSVGNVAVGVEMAEVKRTITQSRDNIIYRVGDKTLVEHMESLGIHIDFQDGVAGGLGLLSSPLLIEDTPGDEPVVRTIFRMNQKDGSGVLAASVKQGATLGVGILRRQDIAGSAQECVNNLFRRMRDVTRENRYTYSTVLAMSCYSRFLIMAPDCSLEGDILTASIGEPLSLCGFYSTGEICPVDQQAGLDQSNRLHNESLTLCAF